VDLLQSPNLMIFALFLKYQTDSPRSGLESGIQIYLLGKKWFGIGNSNLPIGISSIFFADLAANDF
jgi:hypothetical protein